MRLFVGENGADCRMTCFIAAGEHRAILRQMREHGTLDRYGGRRNSAPAEQAVAGKDGQVEPFPLDRDACGANGGVT